MQDSLQVAADEAKDPSELIFDIGPGQRARSFSQKLPNSGTQRRRADAIDLLTKIMKIYSGEMQ